MTAQIIMLAIIVLELGFTLGKHGEYRESPYDRYSFWVKLFDVTIFLSLLYWGGFFDVFNH